MQKYEVGKLYHPGKTRWPEATDFNYRANTLELRMFFARLSGSDIRAIRNGPASFHLAIVNDILFFLFEFGQACPLSDNSYSWWMVPERERTLPPVLKPGEMALLSIILVSAEDGIIRALRQISLGHEFSVKLFDAIREQATKSFAQAEHDRKLATVYAMYPTPQDLLKRASITCVVESNRN